MRITTTIVTLLVTFTFFIIGCSFNASKGDGSLLKLSGSIDLLNHRGTMQSAVGSTQADNVSAHDLGSPYHNGSTVQHAYTSYDRSYRVEKRLPKPAISQPTSQNPNIVVLPEVTNMANEQNNSYIQENVWKSGPQDDTNANLRY